MNHIIKGLMDFFSNVGQTVSTVLGDKRVNTGISAANLALNAMGKMKDSTETNQQQNTTKNEPNSAEEVKLVEILKGYFENLNSTNEDLKQKIITLFTENDLRKSDISSLQTDMKKTQEFQTDILSQIKNLEKTYSAAQQEVYSLRMRSEKNGKLLFLLCLLLLIILGFDVFFLINRYPL